MRELALRCIAGFFLLLLTQQANAATWFNQVSVPVSLEYDTNPAMSATNNQSIRRMTTSPGINLMAVEGLNQWSAGMTLRIERTSNTAVSMNREDPSLNLGWKRELERGAFGISASYDEQSIRTAELEDTGLVRLDGTRTSKSLKANWTRALTERTQLALNGSYRKIGFSSLSKLIGNTTQTAGANLSYDLNERASPYVQVIFTRFQPDSGGNSSNSQTGHVGLRWQASERLSWDVHGGINKTTTGGVSSKGWDGGANLSYATDRTTTSLAFSHTTAPSGAISSLESDRISGSWAYSLTERDRTGANISWVKNRSVDSSDNRQIAVFYGRDLADLWKLNVNYQHKQRQTSGLEANADVLGVTVTYSTPNF